jgi:hypothetical protein
LLYAQATDDQLPKGYDGKWWASADSGEKSGFLNGAADCLTWIAHEKWVSRSIQWAVPKITDYYKAHAADNAVPVVDAWRKVLSEAAPETPRKGGEAYTNPHGYYDGQYWQEASESERRGFLEGYLWCLRTRVQSPSETYSRAVSYYVERISDYVERHPKSDNEAIAAILSRFRDKPKSKASPAEEKPPTAATPLPRWHGPSTSISSSTANLDCSISSTIGSSACPFLVRKRARAWVSFLRIV